MISIDCNRVKISRKAFHDFDLLDVSETSILNDVYLAGYIERDGERKNIKIKASAVVNDFEGGYVDSLAPGVSSDYVSVTKEKIGPRTVNVVTINHTDANFIQFNKISSDMFNSYNGKNYIILKFSDATPIGKTTKVYFPNFPLNKGVCIAPKTSEAISEDNLKEVFFNEEFEDIEQDSFDYFISFIQLVDPESFNSEALTNKTKVIECVNITSDIERS